MIRKWIKILRLTGETIKTQKISNEQVVYPDDLPKNERSFVGIDTNEDSIHTITHSRELEEEDIVHELLHVKFPELTEDNVNILTSILLENVPDGKTYI